MRAYPDTGEPAEFPNLAWKHTELVNIDSVRIRNLPVTLQVFGANSAMRLCTI